MNGALDRLTAAVAVLRGGAIIYPPEPALELDYTPERVTVGHPGRGPRSCPFWWCDVEVTGQLHWLDHVSACSAARAEHIRQLYRAAKVRQAERARLAAG